MKRIKISMALLAALGISGITQTTLASSHREAPFITETPKVDGTDFYMFTSYEPGRGDYVTLIANYLPLQDAYGGPNYFALDSDALYEIHIDNNGDAREDISFQFRFHNQQLGQTLTIGGKEVATPLINFGPAVGGITAGLNLRETYTVSVAKGKHKGSKGKLKGSKGKNKSKDSDLLSNAADGSTSFTKPVDNIGEKTISDYAGYAAAHVYDVNIPGCGMPARLFVGQRKDPFPVNLGEIFDLINLNPIGAPNARTNVIDDKNVTALELEVHKHCLTNGSEPVIGAWTTASLRKDRKLSGSKSYKPAKEKGPWRQVSRLGMPLVNEVVIGLGDKDRFNASKPENDSQFADYVTNPTLPALIETLFPIAPAPTNFPRLDLVTAFLTGVPGLNQPMNVKASEMLRLNTAITPTAQINQENLGVLAGDAAGFPNGRRPGDDVVDIELRVAMGVLCTLDDPATFGCVPSDALAGSAPVTDGVTVSAQDFDAAFPYLTTPLSGSPSN